jgi:hypothetical protein
MKSSAYAASLESAYTGTILSKAKPWKTGAVLDKQPYFSFRIIGTCQYVGLDIHHVVRDIISSSSSSRQLLGTSSLDEEESSRSLHTILQHVLTRTWNASDANLDAVQRALAVH